MKIALLMNTALAFTKSLVKFNYHFLTQDGNRDVNPKITLVGVKTGSVIFKEDSTN